MMAAAAGTFTVSSNPSTMDRYKKQIFESTQARFARSESRHGPLLFEPRPPTPPRSSSRRPKEWTVARSAMQTMNALVQRPIDPMKHIKLSEVERVNRKRLRQQRRNVVKMERIGTIAADAESLNYEYRAGMAEFYAAERSERHLNERAIRGQLRTLSSSSSSSSKEDAEGGEIVGGDMSMCLPNVPDDMALVGGRGRARQSIRPSISRGRPSMIG